MAKKKDEIQTYYSNGLMAEISLTVGKNTTLTEILSDKKEKSIAALRKEHGAPLTRALIFKQVDEMIELLGAELSPTQVIYFCNFLEKEYWGYKLSDLNILTNRILRSKIYGKITLQVIMYFMELYSTERNEACSVKVAQEHSEHKGYLITTEAMQKIYKTMKEEVKKPKKPESERRAENLKANQEKIEELKKEYPDEFKDKENGV